MDLFLPAAQKQMNTLENKNLILKDSRKDLLLNDVVLVVHKDNSSISSFNDLTLDKASHIALGEPKSVPVGEYAEEVLKSLGILDVIKPKAVYGKDVKEVLTWVETGNADAGVVYGTDAKVSTKVKVIATASSDLHKPVTYPVAIIKASKKTDATKEFMSFLNSEKAKSIFEKYGFKTTLN
ncbi:Molybdate-binding protein ModA [bioreactor metagenome]|uniref:Molybdate-binding protein ModA n=1 Tax=bioreactor metagenome TaxID=1076179 RepID=A0A645GZ90_9ZZZZ